MLALERKFSRVHQTWGEQTNSDVFLTPPQKGVRVEVIFETSEFPKLVSLTQRLNDVSFSNPRFSARPLK